MIQTAWRPGRQPPRCSIEACVTIGVVAGSLTPCAAYEVLGFADFVDRSLTVIAFEVPVWMAARNLSCGVSIRDQVTRILTTVDRC
jgi:hypothetical protein